MTAATTPQGSKLTLSYEGIGEMLRSDFMEAEMLHRATEIMHIAQELAHVRTGHFRDSFHTTSTRRGGRNNDRAAGIVYNDDEAALSIEFGTAHMRGLHTLRRALDAHAAG